MWPSDAKRPHARPAWAALGSFKPWRRSYSCDGHTGVHEHLWLESRTLNHSLFYGKTALAYVQAEIHRKL